MAAPHPWQSSHAALGDFHLASVFVHDVNKTTETQSISLSMLVALLVRAASLNFAGTAVCWAQGWR